MKKIRLLIITLILIFIPLIVKADGSGREFYSELLDKSGTLNSKVQYVVGYSSTIYGMDNGESKTGYVKYNPFVFKFNSANEYNTKKLNVNLKISEVSNGVIKFVITSKEEFKQIDYKILFDFTAIDALNTEDNAIATFQLFSRYEYENLTCEDCDGFWMGIVKEDSKSRTFTLHKETKPTQEENNNNVPTNNVEQNNTKEDNGLLSSKNITYALLGANIILVIIVIIFLVKSKKENEG